MDYSSPRFGDRFHGPPRHQKQAQGNSQSPFWSPVGMKFAEHDESPDFIPFNYSSPMKIGMNRYRGNRRYFNNSNGSFSSNGSSGSSYSPYNPRNKKGNYKGSFNNCDISDYVDSTMMEDPWKELENKLPSDCSEESGNLPDTVAPEAK